MQKSANQRGVHLGLLFLRLACGLSLALIYGFPRLADASKHIFAGTDWEFLRLVVALGFPIPVAFATASALAESVCAVLLAAGLWTRGNAALIAFNMLVAAYSHLRFGQSMEQALLYLVAAVALAVSGGGAYSADFRFRKRGIDPTRNTASEPSASWAQPQASYPFRAPER